ncbi:PBP1A family penicillin-binding protein [Roseomonas populi]|uniref:peptidoglycan glycosyltransferase n=1 Tax=Roseomonas populi TaxID=3121582 RepID=A0ABT1X0R7_9PROT|nr:PBP1A family penicillin-binding protein [Roseomonas pecuniae]MCR0980973.1 PBP1A family penicillin-binding protein [Roseomonas pecuniae]
MAGRTWRGLRAVFRPARLLLAVCLCGLAAIGFLAWIMFQIPVGGGMQPDATPASLILESRDSAAFAARGVLRGDAIEAGKLPRPLADAVVAIEDRRFYDHNGVDLRGLFRAVLRNAQAGRARQGASTITQQLARLSYLSQDRSLTRKIQEAVLALWLEARLSKEEILARYMNAAYFGAGAWGADAAARRYFGKGAAELSLGEAAMLAGLVRAPSSLAPNRNPEGAWKRAELVLSVMQETGHATPEAVAAARATPPALRAPPEMSPGRGYFADWAESEARRLIGPLPVDLSVRTTLDPALQDLAERVVAGWLDGEGKRVNATQAALLALSHDGAVLAAVGGRDYAASQFNRITQARRQPGSLFKLFTYAAALESGMTPGSTVVDQPVRIGDWEPGNYGDRFRGPMSLKDAFAHSVNTVAVQLYTGLGRQRVLDVAKRMGLRSEMPDAPAVSLGAGEATLLEMTSAFAAAANNRAVEPYVVRSVRARDRALFTRPDTMPGGAPILSPTAQQGLMELMLAVVQNGTGTAARLDRPVAGKTGTTQDSRDAWFIGMTADVVVGVWVGNDDNSPMRNVTGGALPARIWQDFVRNADRAKTAEAPMPATRPARAPEPIRAPPIRGVANVVDTATVRIGNRALQLTGVIGMRGEYARQLALYLAGREVVCEPVSDGAHRCSVEGRDLSDVVLFNGGGRASADAAPNLRQSEAEAREAGRGVWAGR